MASFGQPPCADMPCEMYGSCMQHFATPPQSFCANCDAPVAPHRCARCHRTTYCSRDCQTADWSQHKGTCAVNAEIPSFAATDASRAQLHAQLLRADVERGHPGLLTQMTAVWLETFVPDKPIDVKEYVESAGLSQAFICSQLFPALTVCLDARASKIRDPRCPLLKLLSAGADPNWLSRPDPDKPANPDGSTALHWLCETAPKTTHGVETQLEIARVLLEAGANVNCLTGAELGRQTPLHRACHSASRPNIAMVQLLLASGADANAQTDEGWTPLMMSMPFNVSSTKFLLATCENLDLNLRSARGSSVLGAVRQMLATCTMPGFVFHELRGDPSDASKMKFLVKELRAVEKALVARGALDSGWRG